MEKTFYRINPAADGKMTLSKAYVNVDHSYWTASDEKLSPIAENIDNWSAHYFKAALEYISRTKSLYLDRIEDIASHIPSITLDELAYCYVRDSLGSGWSLENGYKLTADFMIDMWTCGSSLRFGFLGADISKETVIEMNEKTRQQACSKRKEADDKE